MKKAPAPTDDDDAPLEEAPGARQRRIRLNLFWRTFILLSLLLVATIVVWIQSFRALEFEPRTLHTAQQIATMVNLSRAGLTHSDAIARVSLLKTLSEQEGMRIQPHEPADTYELMTDSALGNKLSAELRSRLGMETLVAKKVNGTPGLWVSFRLGDDYTWLLMDSSRLSPVGGRTVLLWLMAAVGISLAGAAVITRLLNKPIKELSNATFRLGSGDFGNSQLNEEVATSEIRAVNIGFNRMAEQLAKVEQDRAVMLAGISHDLRTPLARLRLETEMSVTDELAREHMVADIVQLDAIIDKFMDYARPVSGARHSVNLQSIVSNCVFSIQELGEMEISTRVPGDLYVYADEVELSRVVTNLLENARRYGKTPETGIAQVEIVASEFSGSKYVLLKIRDHGAGVPEAELGNLLKPFFRGDSARTAAAGAGLGLSIVDKTVQRMGGRFALTNASSGGLVAHIRLDQAPSNAQWKDEQRLQRPKVKRNAFPPTQF
ncbi:HAMP domain-containing protein [Vandammella animalimorsus]|uniref:histidine kinase n=1 Tax=Vandammella animalimorsus TaxID=2029117 RepID=A0A3M6R781_9BURK|nr:ATP-binding protein [Vandammella animalimorsus]RMX11143.1 HAMP domain-containing protein [Vandammella animalimorsus]